MIVSGGQYIDDLVIRNPFNQKQWGDSVYGPTMNKATRRIELNHVRLRAGCTFRNNQFTALYPFPF